MEKVLNDIILLLERSKKMQEYILKNPDSFNLEHIFECGQCFRWNKQEDGSYTGIIKNGVIIWQNNNLELA